ncbi:MAG TPA: DUF2796 domain-containing protein [Gemmatimonas sp.]|uniref:ZrgA family zinc uptake protein n=1 Tax=Gemmatimonas sp. TaxID=1962908 RepID=UPI002EDA354B
MVTRLLHAPLLARRTRHGLVPPPQPQPARRRPPMAMLAGMSAAVAIASAFAPAPAGASSHAWQHVHGQARLMLGVEGKTGQAELRAAGDDVFGFEHAPRTASERDVQAKAFGRLRASGAQLIRFDPALGCTISARDVRMDTKPGAHGEVVATYQIACRVAPQGKPVRFGISAAFPGIDRVAVQLVSDTAQSGATISRDRGQLVP